MGKRLAGTNQIISIHLANEKSNLDQSALQEVQHAFDLSDLPDIHRVLQSHFHSQLAACILGSRCLTSLSTRIWNMGSGGDFPAYLNPALYSHAAGSGTGDSEWIYLRRTLNHLDRSHQRNFWQPACFSADEEIWTTFNLQICLRRSYRKMEHNSRGSRHTILFLYVRATLCTQRYDVLCGRFGENLFERFFCCKFYRKVMEHYGNSHHGRIRLSTSA